MQRPLRIFISHAQGDLATARKVASALGPGHGLSTSADAIRSGQLWSEAIAKQLDISEMSLVILSKLGTSSNEHVREEWALIQERAWSDTKYRIVPLLVGGIEIPPFLRKWEGLIVNPLNWEGIKDLQEKVRKLS